MAVVKILIYLFLISTISFAQTGNWSPPGADLSRPRTLLKQSEIESVRASLSNPLLKKMYMQVYQSAVTNVPSGITNGDRLTQSHIAKNAAFVLLMGKKASDNNLVEMTLEERQQLIDKAANILSGINTAVGSFPSDYDSWQWRSKEIIDFASAYDLLLGAGVDAGLLEGGKNKIQELTGNLHREAVKSIFGFTFFNTVKNNHAVKTAAALGFAAVALNDAVSDDVNRMPVTWVNSAMWNIENVFFKDINRQTEPGLIYGYSEGPFYFRYAMINALPFFKAIGNFLPDGNYDFIFTGNTASIQNPFYDDRYEKLYSWAAKIKMPDGNLPPIEDSYIGRSFAELALTGKDQFILMNYDENKLPELTTGNADLRANFIAAYFTPQQPETNLFEALPESGNLIFRSSDDPDAIYLHVSAENGIARNNSFGHNQADVSSFLLFYKGEMMALDPGYIKYTRRDEVSSASNHNMILVDGEGPLFGTPGASNDADGFIENYFSSGSVDYSEVKTNYKETDILRKFIFINKKYFIIKDKAASAGPRTYTWQLHGNGIENGMLHLEGEYFTDFENHQAAWKKNNSSLLVHSITNSAQADYETVSSVHEISYDQTGAHSSMRLNAAGSSSAEFLSVLFPYDSLQPGIEKIDTEFLSAKISHSNYSDFVFTQTGNEMLIISESQTGLSSVSADGKVNFISYVDSLPGEIFIQEGSNFFIDEEEILKLNTGVDFVLSFKEENLYHGYTSNACSVEIKISGSIQEVTGDNIISYDQHGDKAVIIFSGASGFTIKTNPVISSVSETVPAEFKLDQNYPNPFNPITNIGFRISNSGLVTLKIYNVLGKEVASLINEEMQPGLYHVEFDAGSVNGGLTSGVYFYTLQSGNSIETKKLILMK